MGMSSAFSPDPRSVQDGTLDIPIGGTFMLDSVIDMEASHVSNQC